MPSRSRQRFDDGTEISSDAVLAVSFDDGTARDYSIKRNNGTSKEPAWSKGKFGKAIQFSARKKGGGNNAQKPGESAWFNPSGNRMFRSMYVP